VAASSLLDGPGRREAALRQMVTLQVTPVRLTSQPILISVCNFSDIPELAARFPLIICKRTRPVLVLHERKAAADIGRDDTQLVFRREADERGQH
jgi:hypothetical protein